MTNKKLVLEEKDGNVLAGISQKDCDPLFHSFPGSLIDLLGETDTDGTPILGAFVVISETSWAANPRAPKYTAPKLSSTITKPADFKKKAKPEGKASPKTPKSAHEQTDKVIASEAKEPSSGTPQLPLLDELEAPAGAAAGENSLPEAGGAPLGEGVVATASEPVEPVETATPQPDEIDLKTPPGFYLATGEGPFADIQLAMDALGMPKDKRPTHKRYGRLSKELQAKIIDKTK